MNRRHATLLIPLLLAADRPSRAETSLRLSRDALQAVRSLPVQHQGYWTPLDTVARNVIREITGQDAWRGEDCVRTLLDWTFRPDEARREPLIRVRSGEVRRLLGLPADRSRFSLEFLRQHPKFNERLSAVMRKRRQRVRLDPLDEKVQDIAVRMSTLVDVLDNHVVRPVPHPTDPRGRWAAIPLATKHPPERIAAVRARWQAVRAAYRSGDEPVFLAAWRELGASLGSLRAAHRPDPKLIATELRYNRLDAFRWSWVLSAITAGVALVAMIRRLRGLGLLVWLLAAGTFVLISYGIQMRWSLAGRIPAANMYESMIFMGWGLCLATLAGLLVVRNRLVTFISALMAAIALMLADLLPIDPSIGPVAPVLLDTAWMAIHVPVIMVSYSVLMIAMGFALALLGLFALVPQRTDLIRATDHLHYRSLQVGTILLTIGIITGSMWGSASWGRYWGWDPKEVWSLIAMLGYVAVLHARLIGWLRAFGTALASTVVFWLVVMTYVGVNYVLGIGLHSYAFGKGAVVKWLLMLGGLQLVLTACVVAVHVLRRRAVFDETAA